MPRSFFVGGTDYRHQTFQDIVSDLEKWSDRLKEIVNILRLTMNELQSIGYWDHVAMDFQTEILYTIKYYETSIEEITTILDEFKEEVRKDHVNRIRRLGHLGNELYRDFGIVWHQQYENKEYGRKEFKLVEELYQQGRGMAADMIDLSNVAERLEDFIGKRDKIRSSKLPWLTLNPNFYGLGIDLKKVKNIKKWFRVRKN